MHVWRVSWSAQIDLRSRADALAGYFMAHPLWGRLFLYYLFGFFEIDFVGIGLAR